MDAGKIKQVLINLAINASHAAGKPDAFVALKKGTGPGLAIPQKFIREHGSDFTLSSTVGEGTCFAFEPGTAAADK